MKRFSKSGVPSIGATYQSCEIYRATIPFPALERGWLHSRKLAAAWDTALIFEKIKPQCWFSRYHRENRDPDPDGVEFRLFAIAGFWPSGGFVELELGYANPLDDFPRGQLEVHAESSERAEALMKELLEGYRHLSASSSKEARIGIINARGSDIEVERIPVTVEQTIQRERIDLYYGNGTATWVSEWLRTLSARRYGLSLLTGDPGTGKTTLIRSLAHWLAASHLFYFMPASRFATVDSGAIVTFLTSENRSSKLRKVLILEDAESILHRRGNDNREKVATLLNLTDGLLGDALGLHVICTLNSDLTDLDPALLRPGRLVAHRDFCLLTSEEAGRLARALGLNAPVGDQVSLAELFNSPSSRSINPRGSHRVMGFHAHLCAGAA
jgi:hypothetical protein